MSGLPFSGKTTLSKKIADVLGIKRVSFDEVWADTPIIPGKNGVEKWQYISQKCEDIINTELKNNRSIIYDNLGDNPTNRNKMRDLAKIANADLKIIYINISKDEIIKRRQENLKTGDRHQVSDNNFTNALNNFKIPTSLENPTIYDPNQDIEEWIKTNF